MDDFLSYFLAGMFGEELMRKIATRPYGFMMLWLIGFVLFNIVIIITIVAILITGLFKVGIAPEQSLLSAILFGIRDLIIFFFVTMQPWAALVCLGMGLMFALGYRSHYRNNSNQNSQSSKPNLDKEKSE